VNPYLHPRRAEPLHQLPEARVRRAGSGEVCLARWVVHHAVIRVGDSVLEMGEAHGKYEPWTGNVLPLRAEHGSGLSAGAGGGATSFQEPTDQPYGDRNAGVKDSFGNKWYIATHFKDVARIGIVLTFAAMH
jgi:uncharacterized glyoxalase superfamily protein PhnB